MKLKTKPNINNNSPVTVRFYHSETWPDIEFSENGNHSVELTREEFRNYTDLSAKYNQMRIDILKRSGYKD
jgi:hypothetical protein